MRTCRYPVRVWVDSAHGGRRRMETWNGTNVLITEPGLEVEVSPHVDRLKCLLFETGQQNDVPAAQRTAETIHEALELHGVRSMSTVRLTVDKLSAAAWAPIPVVLQQVDADRC